ncbi:hypothetical protein HGRIS_010785 [Hohenbuehelia grisea]|uniref:Small ribosomal subunit protein uS10 domain-containing protein n=1 Tax=Hohenbuehelia grisea TaxID=104357 RepID=A0ABR3IY42_9AGAR
MLRPVALRASRTQLLVRLNSTANVQTEKGLFKAENFGPVQLNESPKPITYPRPYSELPKDFTEVEYAGTLVHGRGVHLPFFHPRTHDIPVASIQFRSHHPRLLDLITHFATHAASALGIPTSRVIPLPTKRTLWTVPRSPFAHKKSQENFERRVHKRVIKAWDADPEVVERWAQYVRHHALGGVGMRITQWQRYPVGFGESRLAKALEDVNRPRDADKIKMLGEQIIKQEMAAFEADAPATVVSPADEAPGAGAEAENLDAQAASSEVDDAASNQMLASDVTATETSPAATSDIDTSASNVMLAADVEGVEPVLEVVSEPSPQAEVALASEVEATDATPVPASDIDATASNEMLTSDVEATEVAAPVTSEVDTAAANEMLASDVEAATAAAAFSSDATSPSPAKPETVNADAVTESTPPAVQADATTVPKPSS